MNFLIINLIILFFSRIDFDPYCNSNNSTDLIFEEYSYLVKPLKNKELIPTMRLVNTFDEKIVTDFILQEVISGEDFSGTTNNNSKFLIDLDQNIKHVEETIPNLIFSRNKKIAILWLNYLKEVQQEANYKVKDFLEISDLKLTRMMTKK